MSRRIIASALVVGAVTAGTVVAVASTPADAPVSSYVVQTGEGFYAIADEIAPDADRDVAAEYLARANGDTLADVIHPGRVLWYAPSAPELAPTTTTAPPTTTVPPTTVPPTTVPPTTVPPTTVPPAGDFVATFDTASDFYDRFDYGYSGIDSRLFPDPAAVVYQGDHDEDCNGPTTSRTVDLSDEAGGFHNVFWHCQPGGDPAKGHVMTGVNTFNYNIAWFSPKQTFTNVTEVCWDLNFTNMSHRKWTQVLFVGMEDATHYPMPAERGTGGWDLGFTNPDFRTSGSGVSTGIDSWHGDLAGIVNLARSYFRAFDDAQGGWTTPGANPSSGQDIAWLDKVSRFTTCVSRSATPGFIIVDQETPNGPRTYELAGTIPTDEVRVVFQDDNYDGPKDGNHSPDRITWHWDNITITTS